LGGFSPPRFSGQHFPLGRSKEMGITWTSNKRLLTYFSLSYPVVSATGP
jgi:hypothetical protein